MTLTKDDLVNSLYENLDIPKSKATSIIETLLNKIKGKLENKEDVLISGFGKFCVKKKSLNKKSSFKKRHRGLHLIKYVLWDSRGDPVYYFYSPCVFGAGVIQPGEYEIRSAIKLPTVTLLFILTGILLLSSVIHICILEFFVF